MSQNPFAAKYEALATSRASEMTLDPAFLADLADLIRKIGRPTKDGVCPDCGPIRGTGHTPECRLSAFFPYSGGPVVPPEGAWV